MHQINKESKRFNAPYFFFSNVLILFRSECLTYICFFFLWRTYFNISNEEVLLVTISSNIVWKNVSFSLTARWNKALYLHNFIIEEIQVNRWIQCFAYKSSQEMWCNCFSDCSWGWVLILWWEVDWKTHSSGVSGALWDAVTTNLRAPLVSENDSLGDGTKQKKQEERIR